MQAFMLNCATSKLFLLILVGWLYLNTSKEDKEVFIASPQHHDAAPFKHQNRTAIIISGLLRSANLTWKSGDIFMSKQAQWFGEDDPISPAESVLKHLFEPLSNQTGIDVFMYVTYEKRYTNYTWDGSPVKYKVSPNDDHAACKLYSKHPIFHDGTRQHRFFCLYEEEKPLLTPWIANYSMWNNCQHRGYKEQVLQQLYGMYRGNQAATEYAMANNFQYTYKIRLRPDTAFIKPFPNIHKLIFLKPPPTNASLPLGTKKSKDKPPSHHNQSFVADYAHCTSRILYAYLGVFRMGNPDWFNVGIASDMDKLLNRYLDFIHGPFPKAMSKRKEWILEEHLVQLMQEKYHICLHDSTQIWMIVVRPQGHSKINHIQREEDGNQWMELSN